MKPVKREKKKTGNKYHVSQAGHTQYRFSLNYDFNEQGLEEVNTDHNSSNKLKQIVIVL